MALRVYSKFWNALTKFNLHANDANKVAIALSGGPDSMGLAALTARWHQQAPIPTNPPPLALVVDHQLRPDSAEEAHAAARHAADLGLRSRVLTVDWGGAKPKRQHKMLAAREARYARLLDVCREEHISHLLTAHHADDQAETFLLRFIHASGVDGLAGIAPLNFTYWRSHGVKILRPLLNVRKEGLLSVCHGLGLPFALDPTNDAPSYQRNRLRQLLEEASAAEAADYDEYEAEDAAAGMVVPKVIHDVLKLQRLCSRVSRTQQHQAAALLERSVLHTANDFDLGPGVGRGRALQQRQGREEQRSRQQSRLQHPQQVNGSSTGHADFETNGDGDENTALTNGQSSSHANGSSSDAPLSSLPPAYYTTRRRWMHWPSQLAALSRLAADVPHAILHVPSFAEADEDISVAAASRLLQAVSGDGYPPSLSDCTKLAQRVAGGTLVGGFTGGGCTVQPVVRSKGRYMLVVPQRDQHMLMVRMKAAREASKAILRDNCDGSGSSSSRRSSSSSSSGGGSGPNCQGESESVAVQRATAAGW